ncbi:MAG: hypothetical protein M3256_12760 [Actinomycetota bacterium]|nr:hypothetical protein [Actinomycetota bacterium]
MKPQTESEWTIQALNIHGAFFERWCREVVDSLAPWHVKYSNYPVEFGGLESNLDVRADRNLDGHLVSLLIECKKHNPEFIDWIFLPKKGVYTGTPLLINELRLRPSNLDVGSWSFEGVIGGLRWNSPIADEARETRGSYSEYSKLQTEKAPKAAMTKTSNAAITEAARQVAIATQSITREEFRHGNALGALKPPRTPGYEFHHIVPAIVTTARLFQCEFAPADVNPRTGEIPIDRVTLQQVQHLRLEYPMPPSLQRQPDPAELGTLLEDRLLERYQRLQMIVIHSEAFEAFLRDFTLNPNDPMFRM